MQWLSSLFSTAQVLFPLTFLSRYSRFSCSCGALLQLSPNTYLWLVPEPLTAGFSCCSFSLASCEVLANLSRSPATSLSIALTQSCVTFSKIVSTLSLSELQSKWWTIYRLQNVLQRSHLLLPRSGLYHSPKILLEHLSEQIHRSHHHSEYMESRCLSAYI